MTKSIKVNQKRRGRPATGRDPAVAVRLPAGLLERLDQTRGPDGEKLTRSQAIRIVLEHALITDGKSSEVAPQAVGNSTKLAKAAAEKRIDKAQAHEKPQTGRGNRKRALTEIPAELLESGRTSGKSKR